MTGPVDETAAGTTDETAAEQSTDARPDRYLYALVDADRGDPEAFEARGLEGRAVRVLTVEGIGAVVHDCAGLYDSEDPLTVREWLLAHQRVTDAATEAFGAPLPVRFDTVLQGGDETVREWVRSRIATVRECLDRVRGCREYHVGVRWNDEGFEAEVRESDDRLAELADSGESAGEGTAFLREKQYEQRLAELRRARHERLETALFEAIGPAVEAVAGQESPNDGPLTPDDVPEEVVTVAVRAETAREDDLGDRLDGYVDEFDVEVRFTGPWPPYSFVPDLTG